MSNPQAPHPQAHIFGFADPDTLHRADAATAARAPLKKEAWVMVLHDDSSYTGLDGCWFAMTTQDEITKLESCDLSVTDLAPRYNMQRLLEWAIDHGYFTDGGNG